MERSEIFERVVKAVYEMHGVEYDPPPRPCAARTIACAILRYNTIPGTSRIAKQPEIAKAIKKSVCTVKDDIDRHNDLVSKGNAKYIGDHKAALTYVLSLAQDVEAI